MQSKIRKWLKLVIQMLFNFAAKPLTMKYILVLVIFLSSAATAQRRMSNAFISGTFQVDAPEHYKPIVSGRLSGGANLKNFALVGIGIGITKIKEFRKLYVPVFGTITIADFTKKVSPLVVAEPGYGIYNEKLRSGLTREGGFTFFGGGGVAIAATSKANLSFSVGYSVYTFNTGGITNTVKGVGFRFTVTAL
jgi:hypothetical protein